MIQALSNILRPYSFRGKARILNQLCPREAERDATIFGFRTKLDLSDLIQRNVYLGTFEPFESDEVRRYLKRGMTFVDVGANVGYYTLLAAASVGREGHVISFEPSPYAFGRLKQTVEENEISQVQLECAGLSDKPGELKLFLPLLKGNHAPTMVPNDGGDPISVRVRTLDDYLAENGIEVVDLMKIDVEGFEPNVIRGATKYLEQGKIKAILCEFNQDWLNANNSSVQSLLGLIVSYGFKPRPDSPNPKLKLQNIMFTIS